MQLLKRKYRKEIKEITSHHRSKTSAPKKIQMGETGALRDRGIVIGQIVNGRVYIS